MAKLLKHRRPQPSGSATGAPAATVTSAPVAGSPRSRSRFSAPGLVRRLLRKFHARHPQQSGSADHQSDGALVPVSQGVVVETLESEAIVPQPFSELVEMAGWSLSTSDRSCPGSSRSTPDSMEYVDNDGISRPPTPVTNSKNSRSSQVPSERTPVNIDIAVDPPSPSAPLPSVTRSTEPSSASGNNMNEEYTRVQEAAASSDTATQEHLSSPDSECAPVVVEAVDRPPLAPLPSLTRTPGPTSISVKDANEDYPYAQAGVTGSETTSHDPRSSPDPNTGTGTSSQGSGKSAFSSARLAPSAESVIDANLSGALDAAPVPPAPQAPPAVYDVPMNNFVGKRRRLNPYEDPYYCIPEESRLCVDVNSDDVVPRSFALLWQPGLEDRNYIRLNWIGEITTHSGKMIYGATAVPVNRFKGEKTHAYHWSPGFVVVKMVSKVDLFKSSLAYGQVANEAAAMKSLASQPEPSAFVNSALATFQDDDFLYIVSRWYSCSLCEYIGDMRSVLLADHTRECPYVMPPDVFRFYAAELLLGMKYLRQCGVVHCDIKPGNVFVSPSGHLALADFDLSVPDVRPAVAAQDCTYEDVQIRLGISGTSIYTAPERYLDSNKEGIATPRGDMWSLGIVLLELALQIENSYFKERFPNLFSSLHNDYDGAMKIIFEDLGWGLEPGARNSAGTAALDPLVFAFIDELLASDPARRMTLQTAEKHEIFTGMDWNAIRRGVFDPPLLGQGCPPKIPYITETTPSPKPADLRMRQLQESGMLTFADFGTDWIAPERSEFLYPGPDHGSFTRFKVFRPETQPAPRAADTKSSSLFGHHNVAPPLRI